MRLEDNDIIFTLGRLEGKVDAILSNQTLMVGELEDHDKRLGKLERHHSWFLGASAVVASVVATVVGFLKGGH